MNNIKESIIKNVAVMVTVIAMIFTMAPMNLSFADTEYGMQPWSGDNGLNSMKMLEPSDITFVSRDSECYVNQINGTIDGANEEGIKFTFTMEAGMNNFDEQGFLQNNMHLINIYDDKDELVAAGGDELKFLGSHQTDEMNNHGSPKTDELYIGVDKGVLGNGDYVIVFGSQLCGNNTSKVLGKDVKFRFTVKAAPELDKMIEETEAFISSAGIDASTPGCYPQEALNELQTALYAAKAYTGDKPNEQANILYDALKKFKDSMNVAVSEINISGIDDTVSVGDTGAVSAQVNVTPDDVKFKKVKWSTVKSQSSDEPADSIIVTESAGKWTAVYSGTAYIKATSVKDPSAVAYKKITVKSEDGVVAVNLTDKDVRLQDAVSKALNENSLSEKDIQTLKVFTTGERELTDSDINYINGLPNLKTLNVRNATLKALPNEAFKDNGNIEKILLGDMVTSIGDRAFSGCTSLVDLEIPASLTSLGDKAFDGCNSLKDTMVVNAVYPPELKGDFGTCSVSNIKVPYGCIEDFESASGWEDFTVEQNPQQILEVEFTESGTLQEATEAALKDSGLKESEISDLIIRSPEGVVMGRQNDFEGYLQKHFLYATTIDLSGTLFEDNKCNANLFKDRISLKYIKLPETTNTIGGECFSGCKNLRKFTIPKSITKLGNGAFTGCTMLGDSIACDAVDPPSFDGTIFPDNIKTIYVPAESVAKYKDAFGWGIYRNGIEPKISIELNKSSMTVEALLTSSLNAEVKSYDGEDISVFWKSSNENVAKVNGSGKTATITGVAAGTATITAMNATGDIKASCSVTVQNIGVPAVTAASGGYNKVKVSWKTVPRATGYYVYRCSSSGKISKSWRVSYKTLSFTDSGLTTGSTYYYRVRAYKTVNGKTYSTYSPIKSGKPALSTPATPTVKKSSSKYVTVKWKGISGETGYQVYRAKSLKGKYSKVKSVTMASKSYPYAKISTKRNVTYYYKVRAYKKVGKKYVYSNFSKIRSYRLK